MENYTGEIAALFTAICWSITATSFEYAGKKIGSLALNIIRLFMAFIFLGLFTWITRGLILPVDASLDTWIWLGLSGVVGFVMGDLFLFEAFVRIGSRISMLIMASVPPITAVLSFFILGEWMSVSQIIGMTITILGIAIVILVKGDHKGNIKLSHPVKGILFAFGGALGQTLGLILSKFGMADYNAFAATHIRVITGILGFAIVFTVKKRWGSVARAFRQRKAMMVLTIGAIFGPFIGVSLSLVAIQHTNPGVASTIMAITPVLIIPFSIAVHKEKITLKEALGALLTVVGVGYIFMV
ncbi:DMT family transporter [Vallitalea pronyensis]|uniref:DMT family transporter n=1 Tax=Vallitalea pronyensis TaxID=1348613 RepID=A0A8J8MNN2_9FIRM|nr:DMT family transporter [Vallitalea pronyensis]QUI24533.1 DMT family transporter [Vallitalea pronyensis]